MLPPSSPEPARALPRSIVATALGKRGSGKTAWLHRNVIARLPHVLIIDRTGEWPEKEPGALQAIGLDQTLAALQACVGLARWRIVASLETDDVAELMEILVPLGGARESIAVRIGGLAVVVDEVHTFLTPQSAGALLRPYRVGRHAGITMIAADQAPASVNKEIVRASDVVAIFRVNRTAPRDLEYLVDIMGGEDAERLLAWNRERDYRYGLWFPDRELLELREPDPYP
jgi:hypothetical protein